ncbi:exodeoxyribonuclease VII large subunit [Neoehrlichia mikurensis]|uniref:Exodeoxyribonuclease 7 large subunit n=1 Tax=Neoehrlichia mikurensis TaxID=89586 RepID=A0A9Q9BTR0_9RICK|nr:exodeoxyribonuclease VII large subunit [Neoehrlichia mikurensis]QXK92300.1 exodeoxyribonuclease VII large subunit [Neoehrlichia mikurensis]QXK92754.1 exodeoxyribonuclease VII large subunit [Neoehrlichia mikurensis]QXK93995.1 exodeoxyribonuclease VII large subunit [Neoehrlichia mikurensis]UTO55842.1 exodeoxyribonuclease VII large subunit [Neoehrlichia mikurensis]UTO56757.1 exodeoxyribonuclease VII large subunit [Neoehrlichia mikurensis]
MIPEFTVTEITKVFQYFVHETFNKIKVRGEVSNKSQPKSGHTYFTLKDDNAIINAICWNNTKLDINITDGMEVSCTGFLTTYQSKYQLIVEHASLSGLGQLQIILERTKKKLEKEGLFDIKNKKKLPMLPRIIGIITSITGSVLQDIINRVQSRFPTHIVIYPVSVQGVEAHYQIIHAISQLHLLQANRPNVIIIARGGGSIEDLWPFNEELLIRAVANSQIPIISAIGHETDFTLIDYVADIRAPTPTAAVEIALPEKSQFLEIINNKFYKIKTTLQHLLDNKKYHLLKLHDKLLATKYKLKSLSYKLYEHHNKINVLFKILLLQKQQNLNSFFYRINYYNKKHLLNIGYAIVYDKNNKIVDTSKDVSLNDTITIEWKDGKHVATIKS